MATEIRKPTTFNDANGYWQNEAYAYDQSGGGDETTKADNNGNLANGDANPDIRFYGLSEAGQTYSALVIKMNWSTKEASGNDKWAALVSVDGGSSYPYELVALAGNRSIAIVTAQVALPADTDLTQVVVKITIDQIATFDGHTLYLWDIWTEGTYEEAVEYVGDIGLSALPTSVRAVDMPYAGGVGLSLVNTATQIVDMVSVGSLLASLIPEGSYLYEEGATSNEYVGDLLMSLLTDHASVVDCVYAGAVPIVLSPGHASILNCVYVGDVPITLLPSYDSIVEAIYSGAAQLVLIPASDYSYEEGITEYAYNGALVFALVPTHSSIVDYIYLGNLRIGEGEGAGVFPIIGGRHVIS